MPVRPVYDYLYPNIQSYKAMGRLSGFPEAIENNGRGVQHGYIFGYVKGRNYWQLLDPSKPSEIDYGFGKRFQFNPAQLSFNIAMNASESEAVQADGGNLPQTTVGVATTDLKIWFDRTEEVYASANGRGDAEWRALGVQRDIDDLFKILTGKEGEQTTITDQANPWGAILGQSTATMTRRLFDAANGGGAIGVNPIAIIFNPNLAVHVNRVTAFAFSYTRFTRSMVPTTVSVDLSLEIASINTAKTVGGAVNPNPGLGPVSGTTGTSPGSGAVSGTRTPSNGSGWNVFGGTTFSVNPSTGSVVTTVD